MEKVSLPPGPSSVVAPSQPPSRASGDQAARALPKGRFSGVTCEGRKEKERGEFVIGGVWWKPFFREATTNSRKDKRVKEKKLSFPGYVLSKKGFEGSLWGCKGEPPPVLRSRDCEMKCAVFMWGVAMNLILQSKGETCYLPKGSFLGVTCEG